MDIEEELTRERLRKLLQPGVFAMATAVVLSFLLFAPASRPCHRMTLANAGDAAERTARLVWAPALDLVGKPSTAMILPEAVGELFDVATARAGATRDLGRDLGRDLRHDVRHGAGLRVNHDPTEARS